MKKLILIALAAVGVGAVVKNKSEQLKAGAARVTRDPRVQSALATASEKAAPVAGTLKEKTAPYAETVREKAGPVAETVKEKVSTATTAATERLHKSDDSLTPPDVPDEAEEVAETDPVSAPEFTGGDPLTDPLPPEGVAPEPATHAAPTAERPDQS